MIKQPYEFDRSWRILLYSFVIGFLPIIVKAQDVVSNQLWLESFINYSFANVYNLENQVSYRTALDGSPYQSIIFRPTLVRSFTQNVDGQFALRVSYVLQNDTSSSLEIRPTLGSRIHITPNRRVLTRVLFRFEQRNFKDLETNEWTKTSRIRIRPEFIIPLNKKSYFENNQWYALFDVEWFVVIDKDVDERFANRFRLRVGGGYRLNANWRFEFIYMRQESKNKIGEEFYTSDNIWRARVKYYFTRGKKVDADSSGGD